MSTPSPKLEPYHLLSEESVAPTTITLAGVGEDKLSDGTLPAAKNIWQFFVLQ